jgi:four helix bundle protein
MHKAGITRSYRDLLVWRKAMDFVEAIYAMSRAWPKEETYGLTGQIRRAAVSVPSNIAEGQGRISTKEFIHHLSIARGSLLEVETQLLLAERLGYLEDATCTDLLQSSAEVSRLLSGLTSSMIDKLRTKN